MSLSNSQPGHKNTSFALGLTDLRVTFLLFFVLLFIVLNLWHEDGLYPETCLAKINKNTFFTSPLNQMLLTSSTKVSLLLFAFFYLKLNTTSVYIIARFHIWSTNF